MASHLCVEKGGGGAEKKELDKTVWNSGLYLPIYESMRGAIDEVEFTITTGLSPIFTV